MYITNLVILELFIYSINRLIFDSSVVSKLNEYKKNAHSRPTIKGPNLFQGL